MPTLHDWLIQEPFTLGLSSGYFSLFAHCGMVSVLEETGLFPAYISGASSGAIVGSCLAAGSTMLALKELLFSLDKHSFWDPGLGLGLLRGDRFRRIVAGICPITHLENCPTPVAVSAFDIISRRTHVLRRGPIAESVYASCAVPGLFQPIRLNGGYYLDGGLRDRPGLAGVTVGARLLHLHIPSRRWPTQGFYAPRFPERDNMVALAPLGLIPVDPNHFDNGRIAYVQGRQIMQMALATEIGAGRLCIHTESCSY